MKHRVPIWKKEHYTDGDSGWVNCERCAAAAHAHDHDHAHAHAHEHPEAHATGDFASHGHEHAAPVQHDYSRQMALPEVASGASASWTAT